MLGWFSEASTFTLEASEAIRILRERLGQYLERHVPIELGIAGLPDLAHPAFADLGGDAVGTKRGAGLQGHLIRGDEPLELLGPVQYEDQRRYLPRIALLQHQEALPVL